jgi:hypothetical protein
VKHHDDAARPLPVQRGLAVQLHAAADVTQGHGPGISRAWTSSRPSSPRCWPGWTPPHQRRGRSCATAIDVGEEERLRLPLSPSLEGEEVR